MWMLKVCIITATSMCGDINYTPYITEATCYKALETIEFKNVNYVATCEYDYDVD